MTFLLLAIYALATYRLALLLSVDAGPWKMFSKLRSFLKREAKTNKTLRDTDVHKGIDCIRCDSVWCALPVAACGYFHNDIPRWLAATGDIFLVAMALSALAILMNRIK